MIVVDATVLAHLLIGGAQTDAARTLFARDPDWVAPRVWRTAFRELLAIYHIRGHLGVADALELADAAERVLRGAEYEVELVRVLALAARSGRCAMDSEHAALARELRVPFVTADRALAEALAPDARWLGDVAADMDAVAALG